MSAQIHGMAGQGQDKPDKVTVIPMNEQVRELQTILRDRSTTSGDFVFYADRLVCHMSFCYFVIFRV